MMDKPVPKEIQELVDRESTWVQADSTSSESSRRGTGVVGMTAAEAKKVLAAHDEKLEDCVSADSLDW